MQYYYYYFLILIIALSCADNLDSFECQTCNLKVTSNIDILCNGNSSEELTLSDVELGEFCSDSEIQALKDEHVKTELVPGDCTNDPGFEENATVKTRVLCK